MRCDNVRDGFERGEVFVDVVRYILGPIGDECADDLVEC